MGKTLYEKIFDKHRVLSFRRFVECQPISPAIATLLTGLIGWHSGREREMRDLE